MKYTEEQLKEMSDEEINIAVAKKLGLQVDVLTNESGTWLAVRGSGKYAYNPCTRWNDSAPIAEQFNIDILFYKSGATAHYQDKDNCVVNEANNENPKRAVCEVFLLMEGVK